MVRVGDFEFEPATGDLRRVHPEPPSETVRLAPQPAKLLALLIERRGELLEREEIRQAIWPDTHVDFDQSLAFCVRQLRAALGDSGAKPTYVETLPRRGFRLVASVVDGPSQPPVTVSASRRWVVPLLVGLLALIAIVTFTTRSSRTPRLAIMPFELAAGEADAEDRARLARISEWLVAELARENASPIEVIGPRTTAPYHGSPFPNLDALVEELNADYVLNDRYLEESPETPGNILLVELIRLDDRAHPWVERFDADRSWEEVARTIRDGVRAAIDQPR